MIVKIGVKSSNFYNLSLCCKKFKLHILDNIHFWRRKIFYKFKYLHKDNHLAELQRFYAILVKISKNPQLYYRKSLFHKDTYEEHLIYNIFEVYFPYIGITKKGQPSYFSIVSISNLHDKIPNDVINLANMDELSIWNHCKNMGIPYTYDKIFNIINIKKKLKTLNLIFDVGDKNDYLNRIYIFKNEQEKEK